MQKSLDNGKDLGKTTAVVKTEPPGAVARAGDISRLTTPELVARIAQDAQDLLKAEVALAKNEVRSTVQSVGAMAKRFAVAVPLLLGGYLALIATGIIALSEVLETWAAALVVAGALLVPGVILVMMGAKATPKAPMERTRKSLEQDLKLAKDTAT